MTADLVIAGRGGFIGRCMTAMLGGRGVESVDVRAFAKGSDRAKLLVNLAMIADDPAADLKLMNERIELVGGRVDHWLQTQSFVTLTGRGTLQLDRPNAGFKPVALDHYGLGKLTEERRLSTAAAAGELSAVTFAYLPLLLDEGGSWARIRAQAIRNGYVLPNRMLSVARANFAYIADLVDVVVALLSRGDGGAEAVTRLIVNDPLSRTTTWPDLLGPKQLSPFHAGRGAALKRAVRDARQMPSAWRLAAAMSVDRLGTAVERTASSETSARVEPAEPLLTSEPVEFSGVFSSLVRTQAFLPPTSYE